MEIAKIIYQGNLRCEITHLKSQKSILTDAPTDNNGKGEAFSPTDLLSSSLAACMITIMGIEAAKLGVSLGEISASISKIMGVNPRRVIKIGISLQIQNGSYNSEQIEHLKNAAINCPVAKSISTEIIQEIEFRFN